MKNQTVEINFTIMLYTGIMYMGLVISGWILIRLTIACFKLPSILNAGKLQERYLDENNTPKKGEYTYNKYWNTFY